MTEKSKRGGTRPGAGRPAEIADARRVNVTLDPATIERAKEIGAGNVSQGIRTAVAAYVEQSGGE